MEVTSDVLILTGDIAYLKDPHMEKFQFFDWASEHFRQTLIVPGNHEYYGGCEMDECENDFEYKIRDNVSYCNNRSVVIDHVEMFMTTLWSRISGRQASGIKYKLNDFRSNRYNENRLTIGIYNQLHEQSLSWLSTALQKSSSTYKIVVTHHYPTHLMEELAYSHDPINSAFITELSKFIETHNIDY